MDVADNETPPVVIDPNMVTWDMAFTALRYVGIILTSFSTLLAVVRGRDLAAIFDWLRSNEAAPMLSAASSLALMGWGLWKSRHRSKQLVARGKDPTDTGVILKEPSNA